MLIPGSSEQVTGLLVASVAILAAMLTAVWVSTVVWTFRDMRSRTRDLFAQIMAAAVVAILNLPGLLVYLILRPAEKLSEQYERALEEEALLREIENRNVCPGCGSPIREGWRLCPHCHTRLRKECQSCGKLLELPWMICPYCEATQSDSSGGRRRQSEASQ